MKRDNLSARLFLLSRVGEQHSRDIIISIVVFHPLNQAHAAANHVVDNRLPITVVTNIGPIHSPKFFVRAVPLITTTIICYSVAKNVYD